MKTKTLCALTAVASALAPAAAQAHDGDRSTIAFRVQNPGNATCSPRDVFGISFDMVSLRGAPLGSGRSCAHSIDGCSPFKPFCRQTVNATFTLDFRRGSLTAPMKLREILPTENSFIQHGKGRIAAGTGDFAGARGGRHDVRG